MVDSFFSDCSGMVQVLIMGCSGDVHGCLGAVHELFMGCSGVVHALFRDD